MNSSAPLEFTREHLERFSALSHDRNPLHVDPDYAARTFLGQPVVFGALGALMGLGRAAQAQPLRLRSLALRFPRPLLLGLPYELTLADKGTGRRTLRLAHGGVARLLLDYDAQGGANPGPPAAPAQAWPCREQPDEVGLAQAAGLHRRGRYAIDTRLLDGTWSGLEVDLTRLAPLPVAALCWASYFVGMEVPGRQALFFGLKLELEASADQGLTSFEYDARVTRVDTRMSMIHLEATLLAQERCLGKATLQAMVRPPPVVHDVTELERIVPASEALAGKVVLVTGSSRGLGSLTALGCARHGSDVIVHCHRNRDEAARISELVTGRFGRRCLVVQGDTGLESTWTAIAQQVGQRFGRLNVFVHNAYPPIHALELDELTGAALEEHVFSNIKAGLLGFQTLLPLLEQSKGWAVNISSAYALTPPRGFLHYAMAKSALEGLVRGLAASTPGVRFVTLRPPRMLTDQTSTPYDVHPPLAPFAIVTRLLAAIEQGPGAKLTVVDDFAP